jgi:integrase
MTLEQFLASLRTNTANEYRTTSNYIQRWQNHRKDHYKISFADWLTGTQYPKPLSANTIAKHIRQAKHILKKCGEKNVNYSEEQLGTAAPEVKTYPEFTDSDFQDLYNAFADSEYPKFIENGQRQRYWQTIIHFITITALRRQALLGLTIGNVNFQECFVTVTPDTDKKGKARFKAITQELANDILNLRRFYNYNIIPAEQHNLVFPWTHGNKKWYECWQAAEEKIGKRFHLHDLKRFSGTLALRAGATVLELQDHMCHANISTTLLHYCRPQNRKLIEKIKIPLPNARPQLTPLFTEPELQHTIENMLRHRLAAAGIDLDTVQLALDAFGEVNLAHFSRHSCEGRNLVKQRCKPKKLDPCLRRGDDSKNADSEQRIPPKRMKTQKRLAAKKGDNESPIMPLFPAESVKLRVTSGKNHTTHHSPLTTRKAKGGAT